MKKHLIKLIFIGLYVLELIYIVVSFFVFDSSDIIIKVNSLICFAVSLLIFIAYIFYINKYMINPITKITKLLNSDEDEMFDVNKKIDLQIYSDYPFVGDLSKHLLEYSSEYKAVVDEKTEVAKSKKKIISSINHEIKAPIESIRDIAELLQSRTNPSKEYNQLELIRSKASQITKIINEISSGSDDEIEDVNVYIERFSSIDLYDLINDADYDKNCAFIGAIPKCTVFFDKARLEQVLEGIISNSYKYGKTKITVHTTIEGEYLKILIRDYGEGMRPEELTKVFEKFYRGMNSVGRTGAGLGLFVAKQYMDLMDGGITAENFSDGFGITISIRHDEGNGAQQLMM